MALCRNVVKKKKERRRKRGMRRKRKKRGRGEKEKRRGIEGKSKRFFSINFRINFRSIDDRKFYSTTNF